MLILKRYYDFVDEFGLGAPFVVIELIHEGLGGFLDVFLRAYGYVVIAAGAVGIILFVVSGNLLVILIAGNRFLASCNG